MHSFNKYNLINHGHTALLFAKFTVMVLKWYLYSLSLCLLTGVLLFAIVASIRMFRVELCLGE